jgi:hypothetical protein
MHTTKIKNRDELDTSASSRTCMHANKQAFKNKTKQEKKAEAKKNVKNRDELCEVLGRGC